MVSWGYNYFDQTNAPAGLSNVVFISAGWFTSLAITAAQVPAVVELNGQNPVIHFRTFTGQQYSVEFSPDAGANSWTALPGGEIQGDGHEVFVSDTNATKAARRFYRVVRTQ